MEKFSYEEWINYLDLPSNWELQKNRETLICLWVSLRNVLEGNVLEERKKNVARSIFGILSEVKRRLDFDITRENVSSRRFFREVSVIVCKNKYANNILQRIKKEKGVSYMRESSINNLQQIANVIWDLTHPSIIPQTNPNKLQNPNELPNPNEYKQLFIPFPPLYVSNTDEGENSKDKNIDKVKPPTHQNIQVNNGVFPIIGDDEDPNQDSLYKIDPNEPWWNR